MTCRRPVRPVDPMSMVTRAEWLCVALLVLVGLAGVALIVGVS